MLKIKYAGIVNLLIIICLGGCQVGPDFKAPVLPEQEFADGLEILQGSDVTLDDPNAYAAWWNQFNDPLLTELITSSLTNNTDMKVAVARVKQARAVLGMSNADIWPTLTAGGSFTRTRYSEDTRGGGQYNLHTLGLDAGWEIDIFGGVRRATEAAEAELGAQQANLSDVWISLAAEVAINYTQLRVAQKQLRVAMENLKTQEDSLDLLQSLREQGLENQLAIEQTRSVVETTRSSIPPILALIESYSNNIALLTGELPGKLHEKLAKEGEVALPSDDLLVAIPAETLRNRPDISRAEYQLAAQTARIGQATADLYPKFRLAGSIGVEALRMDRMFANGNDTYSIGPSISWSIFDAERIRNNIKVQDALQEQYLAQYEKTVLSAIKEVRDNLVAWQQEHDRLTAIIAAEKAAKEALYFANDRYSNGLIDFNIVLDAQRALLALQINRAASEGQIVVDLIRLYKSFGGGWQMSPSEN